MSLTLDRSPAPRTGRHRAPDAPAAPARRDTRNELTQPMPHVRARLPFPDTAGQLIRHPQTKALAVSCDARGKQTPEAETTACYAVITGGHLHRNPATGDAPMWLSYPEALREGWVEIGALVERVPASSTP